MLIPAKTHKIIEPFAGFGEIIKWIYSNTKIKNIESYDIDPKCKKIVKQDIFKKVPIYKDKFVITNPPYLAKNKSVESEIYNKYKENDLYKCFIK